MNKHFVTILEDEVYHPLGGVFPGEVLQNFGIDFGLFNNRITGSAEYYDKVISDLLSYKPLNTYQELTRVMANIGKTQSTGIEVTLNTRNMILKNFS